MRDYVEKSLIIHALDLLLIFSKSFWKTSRSSKAPISDNIFKARAVSFLPVIWFSNAYIQHPFTKREDRLSLILQTL